MRQAMDEYSALTGRTYSPVHTFMCDDAEMVMVGLGSVADDVEAVVTHLRSQGKKVGVVSIKLLQPFPEAEVVAALKGKAVTVLERSSRPHGYAGDAGAVQGLRKHLSQMRQVLN